MHVAIFVGLLGLFVPGSIGNCQELPLPGPTLVANILSRAGAPSQRTLDVFAGAGMKEVRGHSLTPEERSKVERALDALPELNQRVLEKHLHTLGFVDGIPGSGTGLTSPSDTSDQFDITLRASIINESLSTFLTTKERKAFASDQSGTTLTVHAIGTDALTYVLLHESSHVLDSVLHTTTTSRNPFGAGVWLDRTQLVPSLQASAAAETIFRGHPALPLRAATAVYDALSKTPFVSLYSMASSSEDFAELLAWREILLRHHGQLEIEIRSANGEVLRRYHPLLNPELKHRYLAIDNLLASS